MNKRTFVFLVFLFLAGYMVQGQPRTKNTTANRPKIVVGLMVDQMKWDYLYKFENRYGEGGIKRLMREGFTCENAMIKHAPTVTACGHASVYTGTVPAINGIAGNSWYDREWGRSISNVEDSIVEGVGGAGGKNRSPNNLLVTTIGDELRLATNFQSKVVSVSIKDRGAILPGGHTANGAFWHDGGKFVTSTYYMNSLPDWAKEFNSTDWAKKLMPKGWNTLYPINTYVLSDKDDKDYEIVFKGEDKPVFPHTKATLTSSPFGNTFTLEFAKRAIEGYELGKGNFTDMLTVSLSSPDMIGHQFGPTSIEVEDNYLRLDKDLELFFNYLDSRFGKNEYLLFVTSDHGVNQSPGFLEENKLPTGVLDTRFVKNLSEVLKNKYGFPDMVIAYDNGQLYLNYEVIEKNNLDQDKISEFIIRELKNDRGIQNAFISEKLGSATLPEPLKSMYINGYHPKRSGDIVIIKSSGWKGGSRMGATHGDWNPYDAHIPLVWMGKGIRPGKTNRTVGMTDIAPTLAAILKIQLPTGTTGEVIYEVVN
ncbi:MAG: alkaline phosphatase PafA [Ginsengibacter sp.]